MKNKIILLFICLLMVTGCGNYRELNDLAIVTSIAIDKSGDEYELSFLIANSPKSQTSNKEGEATTTIYSGKGKTLNEATNVIDRKTPKSLYYGHINVVVISEEIAKEGFFKIADWLLRNPETRKQFYIIQSKENTASSILKIVEPLESFPSQSIASLIESNATFESLTSNIKYSPFVERILSPGFDPILPAVSINGTVKKGSNEKNLETTVPKTYIKLNDAAIFRKDKFIDYIGEKDSQAINVLNDSISEFKFAFKYNKADIVFISDNINTKIKLKDFNHIDIKVSGDGYLAEVNGQVKIENTNVVKKIEKKLEKEVKEHLKSTLKKMQNEYKADVFGFGNKLYGKYPSKWKKVEDEWNDKYFSKLNIDVKTDFVISSSGSLNRTLEEVKK